MSRRRTREQVTGSPPSPVVSSPYNLSLLLAAAALILAALGGGMIYDRADLQPGFAAPLDLVGVPLASILGSIALGLGLWRSPAGSPRVRPLPVIFLAFLTWCALSALLAENRFESLSTLAFLAGAFATGAAVRFASVRREAAMAIAVTIAGAASYVAATGVREYILRWKEGNALWRVFGNFTNPDFLAGYLLVALPVTAALFLMGRQPLQRVLAGLALLLQTACLVLTGSRLGLAALIVELAVFAGLIWRGGVLAGVNRKSAVLVGLLIVSTLAVAGGPLLRRLLGSGAESHSARFRVLTWQGTARMTAAHPLFGTGIGTFETGYPPYQVVGYTQHAHSGFLQLAGETGIPGILLAAAGIGAVVVFGAAWVWKRRDEDGGVPGPLVAGCVSGIVGGSVHNLFDSDIYVPAVTFALAGVIGLVLSRLGRPPMPERSDERAAARLRAVALMAAAVLAIWLLKTEGTEAAARIAANGAAADYNDLRVRSATGETDRDALGGLLRGAVVGYQTARSLQPDNPDYPLKLALLYEASGRRDEAEKLYRETANRTHLGKAYYRYGRFLRADNPARAYSMFRRAREKEPNNLSNLLRLADAAIAYGDTEGAEKVYRDMIRLYRSDFGAVRPMPELVDWEFGMAYVGLAQLQLARGDKEGAIASLRDGTGILGEFWRTRHLEMAVIRIGPDIREETATRYESALAQLASLYDEAGRKPEGDEARNRLAIYRKEREEDRTRKP